MKLLLCTFGLIVLLVVVESIPAGVPQPSLRRKGSSGGSGFGQGYGGGQGGGFGGSFVEIPHYIYVPEYQYVEHSHGYGHGHGHGCLFKSSGKSSGCSGGDLSEIAGYLYLLEKFSRIAKPAGQPAGQPAAPESGSGGYQYPKPPNSANAEIILNRLRGNTLTNKA